MLLKIIFAISCTSLATSSSTSADQNAQLFKSSLNQAPIFVQGTLEISLNSQASIESQNSPESSLSFLQQDEASSESSSETSTESSSESSTDETNPLDRDTDDHQLPEDSDDGGDEYSGGDTDYILATSFTDNEEGTGKVWLIPMKSEEDSSYEILGGLEKPVGVCFDINNNFMYVADAGFGSDTGYIYQYEISWDEENSFSLSRNIYAVVYEGESPYDCKVDIYGNLYFVDSVTNQINAISYTDLYSGSKNQQYTLYQADETNTDISAPCSLDLYKSEGIYFVNNENFDTSGTVNYAIINSTSINYNDIQQCAIHDVAPWGVTYSEDDKVFYSLDSGEVQGFDIENAANSFVKVSKLSEPRGLCYGDGKVYIADHYDGKIYKVSDSDEEETPSVIINLQGVYAVFCVNEGDFARAIVVVWVALISYLII
ncbi:unnamed protein product [Blepharisma stoltei]|uniref:SMP-30/Gluconolactonase/LRE-like region domain-containing protein n=1 Tax=Blepharisma stoltei TaxID=1481888 RepID=A0AAU9IWC0_9CILI|nr:unnamed protein product [Blepharisma stoltei]